MKVYELVDLINQACNQEIPLEEYEAVWLNLNIQENIPIEEIEIDREAKTILLR